MWPLFNGAFGGNSLKIRHVQIQFAFMGFRHFTAMSVVALLVLRSK
jgi:hypothetical protein